MSLTVLDDLEQGSDAWLEARRGMVTASVVGRLITPTGKVAHNPESRALTMQLAAERITGETEHVWVTADMERGTLHEPIAADYYAKHYAPVTECGFMVREFDTGVQLGYSPDRLVGNDGLIEVKCPRVKTHIQTVLSGEVPAYHWSQIQAGLLVSGREWLDFVSFSAGQPLYVKRVFPDALWFDTILAAVISSEAVISRMVSDYHAAIEGLHPTDPIPDDLELKL